MAWDKLWRRKHDLTEKGFRAFVDVAARDALHSHLRPQSVFFSPLEVDFVGRYERFESDVMELLDVLGERPRAVLHAQRTEHRPYPTYYDDATREVVREVYSSDIERFGYSFEHEVMV